MELGEKCGVEVGGDENKRGQTDGWVMRWAAEPTRMSKFEGQPGWVDLQRHGHISWISRCEIYKAAENTVLECQLKIVTCHLVVTCFYKD